MGVAEIVAIVAGAAKLATLGAEIIERMTKEGRDHTTPEETAQLQVRQLAAEKGWGAVLAKLQAAEA